MSGDRKLGGAAADAAVAAAGKAGRRNCIVL